MSALLYRKVPLRYRQIRVLEISPGPEDAPLKLTLHAADLLHWPEVRLTGSCDGQESLDTQTYRAISYYWGSPDDNVKVICNDVPHEISANAYMALRRVRKGRRCYVWIDALCIDQENDDEIREQIPMMSLIYAQAEEVIVWLGEGIAPVANLLRRLNGEPSVRQYRQFFETKTAGYNALPQLQDILAMEQLLNLPWFSRVWTKQEIWSSRKATLWYADATCDWQAFSVNNYEQVASRLSDLDPSSLTIIVEKLRTVLERHARAARTDLSRTEMHDQVNPMLDCDYPFDLDLVNVIRRYTGSRCSDPRDHIYGLLAMSTTNIYVHAKDDQKTEMLAVHTMLDYPPAFTFEDFTWYIIGRDDNLSVLFLENAFGPKEYSQHFSDLILPSWVPDWRFTYGNLSWLRSIMEKPLSETREPTRRIQLRHWEPISGTPDIFRRHEMVVTGFRIAKIDRSDSANYAGTVPFNVVPPREMEVLGVRLDIALVASLECCLKEEMAADADEMIEHDLLAALCPRAAQNGDSVWVVHGAFAPLLLRQKGANSSPPVHSFVGPVVFPDKDESSRVIYREGVCLNRLLAGWINDSSGTFTRIVLS